MKSSPTQSITLINETAEMVATGMIPMYSPAPEIVSYHGRIFLRLTREVYRECPPVAVEGAIP